MIKYKHDKFLFKSVVQWTDTSELWDLSLTRCGWAPFLDSNWTACADFPTGVEVADDTTALFIYWRMWWRGPMPRLLHPHPFVDFFA